MNVQVPGWNLGDQVGYLKSRVALGRRWCAAKYGIRPRSGCARAGSTRALVKLMAAAGNTKEEASMEVWGEADQVGVFEMEWRMVAVDGGSGADAGEANGLQRCVSLG